MYFIIESLEQLNKLDPKDECFVQVIQYNDKYHPKLSPISLIYYNDFNKGYIISVDHSECESVSVEAIIDFLSKKKIVYVENLKYHLYHLPIDNMVDVVFEMINETGCTDIDVLQTAVHFGFYRKYQIEDVNRIIPVVKHLEYMEEKFKVYSKYCRITENDKFNYLYSLAYKNVEESGLGITEGFLKDMSVEKDEVMTKDSIIYTSYNLYNITGRPTNSFNHVNFLAIPKTEVRKGLLSKMDRLVEYDFDSYHLKLISDLIGYIPSSGTIDHSYMAKYYFDVQGDPTPEQYTMSKTITFKQLYGSIENKYKSIPFYKKLSKYIDDLWMIFLEERQIKLPTGRLISYDESFNKTKLFNYVIQNQETFVNIDKILKIQDFLKDKLTQLVLITYDAFLFDISVSDTKYTIQGIENILQDGGYKIRRKIGKNYFF